MKLYSRFNNKGFSLAEVMVASALFIIITMAMASMMQNTFRLYGQMQSYDDIRQTQTLMDPGVINGAGCTNALAAANLDGIPSVPQVMAAGVKYNVKKLFDNAGNTVLCKDGVLDADCPNTVIRPNTYNFNVPTIAYELYTDPATGNTRDSFIVWMTPKNPTFVPPKPRRYLLQNQVPNGAGDLVSCEFVPPSGVNAPVTHGSRTFTSSGTFPVPDGITSIAVDIWGGGSGGGGGGGGGGMGSWSGGCCGWCAAGAGGGGGGGGGTGEYRKVTIPVTPQTNLSITIGGGGGGGGGGAMGSDSYGGGANGNAGSNGGAGGNSSVTGQGVNLVVSGGSGGIGGTGGGGGLNNGTWVNGGVGGGSGLFVLGSSGGNGIGYTTYTTHCNYNNQNGTPGGGGGIKGSSSYGSGGNGGGGGTGHGNNGSGSGGSAGASGAPGAVVLVW